jgi:L-seryl-tRNA(Ser) seleniumtransferase
MGVYESLGVQPIINASGGVTRLGGTPMPAEVLEAFHEAAGQWVPLEQLQAAASKAIAQATGAEAGLVTAGSAAALTLGAAAIMTGYDPGRMERLPHADDFPNEFVVAREHRSGYDHAVRAAGARLVEVGFNEIVAGAGVRRAEAWEFEAAFNERTAGVLYTYGPDSQPPLRQVVEVARRHKLPVLVDAAGELPPRSNLKLASTTGADLVAFSGGKAIRGPQSTGVLCGTADLIATAALQMLDMDDHWDLWDPPADFIDKAKLNGMPRHGLGRAMKVSKEEIVALLTALNLFVSNDTVAENEERRRRLRTVVDGLAGANANCKIVESADGERPPNLEIAVASSEHVNATKICRALRKGSPPIYVGHGELHENKLVINPMCLAEGDAEAIAKRLQEELSKGQTG